MTQERDQDQEPRPERGRPDIEVIFDHKPSGALWGTPTPGLYKGFVDVKGHRHRLCLRSLDKEANGDNAGDS